MLEVVSDGNTPDSLESKHASLATWPTLLRFALTMALDVGLG